MDEMRNEELPPTKRLAEEPIRAHEHPMRYDPTSRLFWAALLILAGTIFLASSIGILPRYGSADSWDWIMLGAGGLLLINTLIRTVSPSLRRPSMFWTVVGIVLVILGASAVFSIDIMSRMELKQWWPAILILLGLSGLISAIRG